MADIGTLIDGGYVGINDEECERIPSQCYQTISKGRGKYFSLIFTINGIKIEFKIDCSKQLFVANSEFYTPA